MKIGELAKLAGVTVSTVHYLESQGLMLPPPRTATGLRVYDCNASQRLIFIRQARALGLPLEEIATLLAITDGSSNGQELAERSFTYLDSRIARLQKLRRGVTEALASSEAGLPDRSSPILEALTEHALPGHS